MPLMKWCDSYLLCEDVPYVLVPGLLAGIHEGCGPLAYSVHRGYWPGRSCNSLRVGSIIVGRTLSHCRRHHWTTLPHLWT
jgi:hypothetical protein